MKVLNEDLRSQAFKPCYCLYGEESFLKRSYKNRFRQAICQDGSMNYDYFEGSDADPAAIRDVAETMPFFAERRLVLVENSGLFKKDSGKLADFLSQMPDTTCLVFVEDAVDKRNKLYKKVKDLGHVVEMNHPEEKDLRLWAGKILSQAGKRITNRNMDRFLELTGRDMELVKNELDKLISYAGEETEITGEMIDTVVSRQTEGKIFDMIRAVAEGKPQAALDLYYDLLALKEPPMRILVLITRQFNQLLQAKELMEAGKSTGEIAKTLGLIQFVAGKVCQQASAYPRARLIDCVRRCIEAEELVKTGRMQDVLAVEMLIVAFSKGE